MEYNINLSKNNNKIKIISVFKLLSFWILNLAMILSTYPYPIIRNIIIVLLFFLNILIFVETNKNRKKKNMQKQDMFYIFFVFFMILSSIYNLDYMLLMGAFFHILIFINFKYIMFETESKNYLLYFMPILFFTVFGIFNEFSLTYFKGYFLNSNTLGMFSVTLLTLLIIQLNETKLTFKKMFLILFLSFLLVISSSRTSFIVFIFIIIFSILTMRDNKRRFKSIIILTSLLLLIMIIPFTKDVIYNSILNKFVLLKGNQISSRDKIWQIYLSQSRLLGNNRNFNYGINGQPHNTIISYIIQYGYISTFFFILFLLSVIRKAINLAHKGNNKMLLITILFVGISMMESIAISFPSLLFYFILWEKEKEGLSHVTKSKCNNSSL